MPSYDLSKNRETTGLRRDTLVRWRQTQSPVGHTIDVVEYHRIAHRTSPPYFAITAFVHLVPLTHPNPMTHALAKQQHDRYISQNTPSLHFYHRVLPQLFPEIPVYLVSYHVPGPFRFFIVTHVPSPHTVMATAPQYAKLIGQFSCYTDYTDSPHSSFSTYSQWHRERFSSAAYFHDIDLIEGCSDSLSSLTPRWVEVTQAKPDMLQRTFFAFLVRAFAQIHLYTQLATLSHGEAFLTVHSGQPSLPLIQCPLSTLPQTTLEWIDTLSRQRERIVKTLSNPSYSQRMGIAVSQLFEQHAHDSEFDMAWRASQPFPNYSEWLHFNLHLSL